MRMGSKQSSMQARDAQDTHDTCGIAVNSHHQMIETVYAAHLFPASCRKKAELMMVVLLLLCSGMWGSGCVSPCEHARCSVHASLGAALCATLRKRHSTCAHMPHRFLCLRMCGKRGTRRASPRPLPSRPSKVPPTTI